MKKKANGKEKTEEKKDTPVANPFFQKDFVSWAGAGFITKILGYLRDALLVAAFGGSALTDAYYAAFRIINLFRRTIGEGGLNAVFIPGYAVERNKGGANAEEFSARFWTATLAGSLIIATAGILLCRPLTFLTAAGFMSSPDYFTFTALLTAVFAPHFLFVNVSAYFTALLNSSGRFFLPAVSQAFFSLAVIAVLILYFCGAFNGVPPKKILLITAAAASASGLFQVIILIPSLKKEKFSLRTSALKDAARVFPLVIAAVPASAVLAQDQLSLVLDTMFASFLPEGSITALYNSSRLAQFPVSLFAAAAAATALPFLSRFAAEKNFTAYNAHLYRAVFTSQLMLLPAAAGLAALSFPICTLLFEHGNFTPEQTRITALTLIYFCPGIPAFGLNKVLAAALYASGKPKIPAAVIGGQLLLNAVLCSVFMHQTGAPGLMLATSLSSVVATATFLIILHKHTGFSIVNISLARILFCAALSGGCAWLCTLWFESSWAPVITGIPVAAVLYFTALSYLDVSERKLLMGRLLN